MSRKNYLSLKLAVGVENKQKEGVATGLYARFLAVMFKHLFNLCFLWFRLREDIPSKEDFQEEHKVTCVHHYREEVDVWKGVASFSLIFVINCHTNN